MTQLIVELVGGGTKTAALSREVAVRIGAQAGLEIELAGAGVLPIHAQVVWQEGAWQVAATPSAGTIELNGRSITSGPLRSGDMLRLGEVQLSFALEEAGEVTRTEKPVPEELGLAQVTSLSQFKPIEVQAKPAEQAPAVPTAADDELGLAPLATLSAAPSSAAKKEVAKPVPPTTPQSSPAADDELGLADLTGLASTPVAKDEASKSNQVTSRPAAPTSAAKNSPARNSTHAARSASTSSPPSAVTARPAADKSVVESEQAPAAKPAAKPAKPPAKSLTPALPAVSPEPADDDLLGGLLAGGDWESGASSGLTGGLESLGSSDAKAGLGQGSQATPMASQAKPAGQTGRARRVAGWFLAATPLVVVAGLAAFIVLNLPSADRQWELALASYDAKDWSQAESRLQAFAQAYPRHAFAAEARIRAGLCRIQPWVDSGADWSKAVSQLEEVTLEWGPLCWHPMAQVALNRVVPPIAQALAVNARSLETQQEPAALRAALRDAQIALSVARRTLSVETLSATELAEAERTVKSIQSRQRRADISRDAIAALQGANGLGSVADLAVMLSELQQELPEGEFSPELTAAIDEFVTGLPAQMSARSPVEDSSPQPAEPTSVLRLACRRSSPAQLPSGGAATAIAVPATRCAYGVEIATGRLLWRRCIGSSADFQPAAPSGTAAALRLILNAARQRLEAVNVQTGEVIWTAPSAVLDPAPLLTESCCVQATHDGLVSVWSIDDGRSFGQLQLPQKVRAPPVAEAGGAAFWIAAESEFAYRIELDPIRCTHVLWLGHPHDGISLRPFVHSAHVVFIENRARGDGRMHVVGGSPPRVLEQLELPERIVTPPVSWEAATLLVAESGAAISVQWRDDERAPASLSQQVLQVFEQPVHVAQTPHSAVLGGRRLQSFDAAANGAIARAELSLGPCRIDAIQLVETGGWVVALSTSDDLPRIYLAYWLAQADECIWITELGLAEEALPPQGGSDWQVVTSSGEVTQLGDASTELGSPSEAGTTNMATVAVADRPAARLFALSPLEQIVATDVPPQSVRLLSPMAGSPQVADSFLSVGAAQAACCDASGRCWLGELGAAVHVFQSPKEHLGLGWLPGPAAYNVWSGCWPLSNSRVLFVRADGLVTTWEYNEDSGPRCISQSNLTGAVRATGAVAVKWLWLFHDENASAINLDDGQVVAERSFVEPLVWGPARVGPRVLVEFGGGKLISLTDRASPEWESILPSRSSVVAATEGANGRLWLATSSGDVWSVDATTGEVKDEPVATSEAIRRLYWHDSALWALAVDGAVVRLSLPEDETNEVR